MGRERVGGGRSQLLVSADVTDLIRDTYVLGF